MSNKQCRCTPYKGNANGSKPCKYVPKVSSDGDVGNVNRYPYLRHEFEQAKKRGEHIIIGHGNGHRLSPLVSLP